MRRRRLIRYNRQWLPRCHTNNKNGRSMERPAASQQVDDRTPQTPRPSVELEVEPQTKLHLPLIRQVAVCYGTRECTETSGVAGVEQIAQRIAELIVIEEVGEYHLELRIEALGDLEHLSNAQHYSDRSPGR
jgi:hypothetical protein